MSKPRTYEERYSKHPEWFRKWQKNFYNSKEWKKLRKEILLEKKMISDYSGQLITGKAVVDHIIEISPENYTDENITMGRNNLQLLSIEEHNRKTFSDLDMRSVKEKLNTRVDHLV